MSQNIWLALPALTALLIQSWLFFNSNKRSLISKSASLVLLYTSLMGICLIELVTYLEILSPSLMLMKLYYVSCFLGLAGIVTQAIELTPLNSDKRSYLSKSVLTASALLIIALLTTSNMITGFEYISYSYTREPGPYYWVIQLFILTMTAMSFGLLFFASKKNPKNNLNSKRARVLLVAIAPLILFGFLLVPLMQLGLPINASVLFPVFTTYFLLVLIETERREALFSILMRMPFSEERKSFTGITEEIQNYLIKTEILKLAETGEKIPLKTLTNSIENKIVEWAVQMSDGSQVQAANLLGVSTSSVCRKKKKI